MLDSVEHTVQPRQGMPLLVIDLFQSQLGEPPVGDVADVGLDVVGRESFHRTQFEGEIDEGVFVGDDGFTRLIEIAPEFFGPDVRIFRDEGPEQLDD